MAKDLLTIAALPLIIFPIIYLLFGIFSEWHLAF